MIIMSVFKNYHRGHIFCPLKYLTPIQLGHKER